MAEETPRGQCQLSKSKEEFGDEGDKLLHENPGEVVSSLGCSRCGTAGSWEWAGEGKGSATSSGPSAHCSLGVEGWVGSKA